MDNNHQLSIIETLDWMLQNHNKELTPEFCPESPLGYSIKQAAEYLKVKYGDEFIILDSLAEKDVLSRKVFKILRLCPYCNSYNLRVRSFCPECKTESLIKTSLLHHYKCGCVDTKEKYQNDKLLICPKCTKILRNIGVDYEKLSEVHYCENCKSPISNVSEGYECFSCGMQFDKDKAIEQKIYTYSLTAKAPTLIKEGKLFADLTINLENIPSIFGVETYHQFLELEKKRIKRYGGNVCLIRVGINNSDESIDFNGLQGYQGFLVKTAAVLKNTLRESDVVGMLNDNTFEVFLASTDRVKGQIVKRKIKQALREAFDNEMNVFKPVFNIASSTQNGNVSKKVG